MIERIKYIVRDIDDEIMGAQHYAKLFKKFREKDPEASRMYATPAVATCATMLFTWPAGFVLLRQKRKTRRQFWPLWKSRKIGQIHGYSR